MFKSALLLLVSSAAVMASPTPQDSLEARQGCVVNYSVVDTWVEVGMTRHRVDFSSEGTPTEEWCRWWIGSEHTRCGKFNPQCYYSEEAGTWRADSSWFRGPVGDGEFEECLASAIAWWQDLTGCSTG